MSSFQFLPESPEFGGGDGHSVLYNQSIISHLVSDA